MYSTGNTTWISYLSTGNLVRIDRSFGSAWEPGAPHVYSGMSGRTALSAFNDHVYCAFELTPRGFFCDGFESGGTGGWTSSSPEPAQPRAEAAISDRNGGHGEPGECRRIPRGGWSQAGDRRCKPAMTESFPE